MSSHGDSNDHEDHLPKNHEHGHAHHGHEHGKHPLDSAAMSERGIRASINSLIILLFTAVFQSIVVYISGSVALLSDTIHNFADASTAIPLWIAFRLSEKPPSQKFTYGLGRLEDIAGLFIVVTIITSALVVGYEAVQRFIHPKPVTQIGLLAFAAILGFAGNEAVALYRVKIGKEIGSAAMVADGYHARADGLTSLAVLASAIGVWFGYPIVDPVVSLIICAIILKIGYTSTKPVIMRLIDGINPEFVEKIKSAAEKVEGVLDVTEIRIRWLGHRMLADANIAVRSDMTVDQAHEIANRLRHDLLHDLEFLSDVTIHIDPISASGKQHHKIDSHQHGNFPEHSHESS